MARHIDALTANTLKNLREQWWDAEFSEFLQEALRPRPGTRILDVGCGDGHAEVSLGRLRISQLRLFGIDRNVARVARTATQGRSHNFRLGLAGADVGRLPFVDGVFDATFCVAVLQHVADVAGAVAELARVTRPGGRVLAVEPDNGARYWYSSLTSGREAYAMASRFFAAVAAARGDTTDPTVGPRLSSFFRQAGLEPISVQLFPVSVTHIGPPAPAVWQARRDAVASALEGLGDATTVSGLAAEYLETLARYEAQAVDLAADFLEIQNTMLFATVGENTQDATEAADSGNTKNTKDTKAFVSSR
jgi:ubiquinone/menaquinone biosynthesis C-methylase UbiE